MQGDVVAGILAALPRPFRRWWAHRSLRSQLSGLIFGAGLTAAFAMQTLLGAVGGAPGLFLRWAVVLSTVLAVVMVATTLVMRTIRRVITDARALVDGDYECVRTQRSGSSAEVRDLEQAFDMLAMSISEREQVMQSEILQMREIERLKDEFVSTVSHELRTPLTSVRGALGLLLGGPLGQEMPPKARDLLRIALSNSERLIRLINDILDVEKMEAGQMSFREEQCDLGGILRATVAGVQSLAHASGVRLSIEGDDNVQLLGDADRLVQVFTNLVSNAIKVSPQGEVVRLRVAARGTQVNVQVIDRGPGIPEEFRDRMFGKFQQADAAVQRRSGGTGLGLAIARAITEKHGGTVAFETELGAGTTFSVGLPCIESRPVVVERAAGNSTRILLVEQDDSMRRVLEVLCAPLGEVVAVRTSAEMLSATRREVFDSILIDPELADGNAFALIRKLRTDDAFASVPVLIFSAREYGDDELAGVMLAPSHAFVKSRDREADVLLRLRAILAVRSPRTIRVAA